MRAGAIRAQLSIKVAAASAMRCDGLSPLRWRCTNMEFVVEVIDRDTGIVVRSQTFTSRHAAATFAHNQKSGRRKVYAVRITPCAPARPLASARLDTGPL